MNFGIVHETRLNEKRVCLTPSGSAALIEKGHEVFIESGAGEASGFSDEQYRKKGVQVVYSHDEIYGRSDVVLKILPMTLEALNFLRGGQTVITFQHMAISDITLVEKLIKKKITVIGMEIIEKEHGHRPFLNAMSEIGGKLAPILAGNLLGVIPEGKGLLLGRVTGVAPASIGILGAGTAGACAARAFVENGAQVHVLDRNIEKLAAIQNSLGNRITTMMANTTNIQKVMSFSDVFLGAVLIRGGLMSQFITRDMIKTMKPKSVFMDYSIDEGGISETSRPTTHSNPTYIDENVIHYCVPNISSGVSRTASIMLSNLLMEYTSEIGEFGIETAVKKNISLKRGCYLMNGKSEISTIKTLFGL